MTEPTSYWNAPRGTTMYACEGGEYATREDYARLEQECERLRGLLADVKADYTHAIHWEDLHSTMKRIDAALSAKP